MAKDTRTYRDRAAYNILAVAKRRKKLKLMAVELKGGKCQICGYHKCISAMDFHHVNEKEKSFALGLRGLTRSWHSIEQELRKCILVCANCHREIHAGLVDITALKVS